LEVTTPAISITNAYIQKAAITKQIVALSLGSPALVEIGTLVNWPFYLYNFTMNTFPVNTVQTITYTHDDCSGAYGTQCNQFWRTSLGLYKDACTLNGNYNNHYTLFCNPLNTNNCSLNQNLASDTEVDIAFTLQSENFCAEISVDVGITGIINCYENQSFALVKTAYIVNRRVFYLIQINSDLNNPNTPQGYNPSSSGTVVTFASLALITVDISYPNGTLVRIWDNGTAVVWANTAQKIDYGTLAMTYTSSLSPAGTNPTPLLNNAIGFSFIFSPQIAQVPKNGQSSFTVVCTVQATYNNLSKKRFILASSGSDSSTFSQDNSITDDTVADTTTGAGPTPSPSPSPSPSP